MMSNYFTNKITRLQGEFLSLFDASLDSQKLILSIFKELSNHSRPGDMWTRLIPHIDEEEFNSLYHLIEQGENNLSKSYKCSYKSPEMKIIHESKSLYYKEKAYDFFTKWCKRILELEELRKKEREKEYRSRPEVKEHRKKYRQRPEVREKKRIYDKEYSQRPEVKKRKRVYGKEYRKKPEVKEKRKIYNKEYRRRNNNGKNQTDKDSI